MRTLGRVPARRASMALLLVIASILTACGDAPSAPPSAPATVPSSVPHGSPPTPDPSTGVGPAVVMLPTYDGSGEAVHPDAVTTPAGWSSMTDHVVATPYPGGQVRFENPSYYDIMTPRTWLPPATGQNPLVMPTPREYLSDPDMIYDPDTHALWVYYREVADSNRIFLIRSPDGTHWDAPVNVLTVPNHSAISPAVVRRRAGDWLMWTVNAGVDGCTGAATTIELRHSADGVKWSAPAPVQIGIYGETPWHIDVEWIPSRGEYWAVYNAKGPGSCMTRLLRFATSTDGVTWTVRPAPLLRAGAIPEFADVVYRASIEYDAARDVVTLLYSGAAASSGKYVWQMATEQLDLRSLMARTAASAATTPARDMIAMSGTTPAHAPELTNETAP